MYDGSSPVSADSCRLTVVAHLQQSRSEVPPALEHWRVHAQLSDTVLSVRQRLSLLHHVNLDAVTLCDFWQRAFTGCDSKTLRDMKLHDLSVVHCYVTVPPDQEPSHTSGTSEDVPLRPSLLHVDMAPNPNDMETAQQSPSSRTPGASRGSSMISLGMKQSRCILGLVLILVLASALAIILLEAVSSLIQERVKLHHAIVIDGGSSGTKVHLYQWNNTLGPNGLPNVTEVATVCKDRFEKLTNGDDAINQVLACITRKNFTSLLHKGGPRRPVRLYLYATAGARLVAFHNASIAEQLFQRLRERFSKSGYLVEPVNSTIRIISGQEEATAAWVMINYVKGRLLPPSPDPLSEPVVYPSSSLPSTAPPLLGSLDLGGASTQVTFPLHSTEEVIEARENQANVTIFGHRYRLYAKSFLCLGKDQAQQRMLATLLKESNFSLTVENPCREKGNVSKLPISGILNKECVGTELATATFGWKFELPPWLSPDVKVTFIGTGRPEKCESVVNSLLMNSSLCNSSACTIFDVYKPRIRRHKYLAISGYYYIRYGMKLNETFTYDTFRDTVANFCVNWTPVGMPEKKVNYAQWHCMEGYYIMALLRLYGFTPSEWTNITFVSNVMKYDLGWNLGFLLTEMVGTQRSFLPSEEPRRVLPRSVLLVLVCVCAVGSVTVLILYCYQRRGRPPSSCCWTPSGGGLGGSRCWPWHLSQSTRQSDISVLQPATPQSPSGHGSQHNHSYNWNHMNHNREDLPSQV